MQQGTYAEVTQAGSEFLLSFRKLNDLMVDTGRCEHNLAGILI